MSALLRLEFQEVLFSMFIGYLRENREAISEVDLSQWFGDRDTRQSMVWLCGRQCQRIRYRLRV